MDVVVAQGLLAETFLLKLSLASRGTVTRVARHNAMKNEMQKKIDRKAKILTMISMEVHRNLHAFSYIATSNNRHRNQAIALSRINAMQGEPATNRDVWRWAEDYQTDVSEEEGSESTEPEEEAPFVGPVWEDPTAGEIFQL